MLALKAVKKPSSICLHRSLSGHCRMEQWMHVKVNLSVMQKILALSLCMHIGREKTEKKAPGA